MWKSGGFWGNQMPSKQVIYGSKRDTPFTILLKHGGGQSVSAGLYIELEKVAYYVTSMAGFVSKLN